MINITNNEIKFNDLEEKMWKKKMQEGLEELRNQLRTIDNQLLKDKNNAELEVKDFQKTTIKCKFGDLEFYRRRYKLIKNGKTRMVYLLDIYLELGYSGQYSQSIVELVLREATEKSYRKTTETIRETTNVSNSNGTDWYSYVETTDSDMTDGGTTNGGNSHWANAKVTVDNVDSYFVWIPRYAYRIIYFDSQDSENAYRAGTLTEEDALANGKIVGYSDARGIVNAEGKRPSNVVSQTAISVNDKYFKTHPAFDGDVNYGGWAEEDGTPTKLQGIWVAKYEASEGTNNKPKSESGVSSWRSITIGNMFTNAQNYNPTLNSHLMKNSEWGAVAYLTESKYGRNGTEITISNNGITYYTGGGSGTAYVNNTNQSSTGNIYGIYDLSGNADEYVAGYYNGNDAKLDDGNAFASVNKSSDAYSTAYDGFNEKQNYKYGDATYETSGWNNDSAVFLSGSFFSRGGSYFVEASAGVFYFNSNSGYSVGSSSFRVSLTIQ